MSCFINKKKLIAVYLFLLICFTGCTVHYIPDYNASLSNEIVDVAKHVDAFYAHLLDTPDSLRIYEKYSEAYTNIEVDLNSIIMRNQVRPLNKESTQIAKNSLNLWMKYKNEHKKNNGCKDVLINLHREDMAKMFNAMFNSEEAKQIKQGNNN